MHEIDICPISPIRYHELSVMIGELLREIMDRVGEQVFRYDESETTQRAKTFIEQEKYWVFLAIDTKTKDVCGFVSLYESYALYSEGAYGTIPELFVRPEWRSKCLGKRLLKKAVEFGRDKGWSRLEVTTPPLPQFEETLRFYRTNGFDVSGGKKLKVDIRSCSNTAHL